MIQKRRPEAFSLVELIIVMSIITLLSIGAAVAFSYRGLLARQESAFLEFTYNMRKIQNFALTGVIDENGDVPQAYGIYVEAPTHYILFRDYNGNSVYDEQDTIIDDISLPEEISITPDKSSIISTVPTGFFCFDDDALDGNADCASFTEFSVDIEGSSVNKRIFIDHVSGQISSE